MTVTWSVKSLLLVRETLKSIHFYFHSQLQLIIIIGWKCVSHLVPFVFAGDIGNYYYGQGHPMKPHRIRMTHNLLLNYGLYRKMEVYVCFPSM